MIVELERKNPKKTAKVLGIPITLCFLAVVSTLPFSLEIGLRHHSEACTLTGVEWSYIEEEEVTPFVVQNKTKDPEFFRLPDHSLFMNDDYYYLAFTADQLTGMLRTKSFTTYEFVGEIQNLPGKVAPYVLLNPDDDKFYMFYSDWGNIIKGDINYARLGLAVGNFSEDFSSNTFQDQGYVEIEGSPLISPEAGWDPYIVKLNNSYYMIFSSAKHGVHLAMASQLGTNWGYVDRIVTGTRENPALFSYKGTWYMLIGIYNGIGYDLYSSEDFLNWNLVKTNWFIDPEYLVLPAGSTCALVNSTLYHLYQVPLSTDYISGPFSLKLALCKLPAESLIFLAYSPYWFRGSNWGEVALDLELIRDMGFDGVRIHYENVVRDRLVESLLNYTRDLGLKVIWATHATYWGSKYPTVDFPNETIVREYKNELEEIAINSSKYSHVLYITVFYPIPWPEPYNINWTQCMEHINSSKFNDALEDIVGLVKSYSVPCAMESEGRPWDFPVQFIDGCDAYFIQPYSGKWDDIDAQGILEWKSYFEEGGKEVCIGEYGFRMWRPCYHWDFGMVSSEKMKAELMKKYFSFAGQQFDVVTYFAMYDGEGDWGLVNWDRTLRLSGWSAGEWLCCRNIEPWSSTWLFNVETYNVSIHSNAIITSFNFDQSLKQLSFNVTDPSEALGFCNVTIPLELMKGNFTVLIDGNQITDYDLTQTNTHSFLHFTYSYGSHRVEIIPEFPSFFILPLFMIATLLAIIVYRRKHSI